MATKSGTLDGTKNGDTIDKSVPPTEDDPLNEHRRRSTDMRLDQKATLKFKVKQVDDIDDKFYSFTGLASTGDLDLGGDRILDGAFSDSIVQLRANAMQIPDLPDKKRVMPVLWQHDMDKPVGSFVDIREVPNGLEVTGIMPKSDTFVSGRVIPQMRAGSIGGLSIGYITEDFEYDGSVRNLKRVSLLETSIVTIPMNTNAKITSQKAVVPFQDLPLAARNRPWDSGAAIMRLRTFLDSEEVPGASYRRAFLFVDESAPEMFGSYKLPIADVIDGELMAVPRAIFAVAGVLRGGRGGVDLPEADRPGITRNVERYYEKLGLESPFMQRNCLRVDELESLTERQLEALLKSGVVMSGDMAKRIVSAVKSLSRDEDETSTRDAELKTTADLLDKINFSFKQRG